MVKIFVSYRRDDGAALAGRLRDRLVPVFGAANVFVDVDNLGIGERFDQKLEQALNAADVFIPVIGRRWLTILDERARLPRVDYVRWEALTALQRGIPVIPLTVDGAGLPDADQLPDDLRTLPLHGGYAISHDHFDRDVAHFIAKLRERWPASSKPLLARGRTGWLLGLGALLIGMVGATVGVSVYQDASKFLFPAKKVDQLRVEVAGAPAPPIPATTSTPNLARPTDLSGIVRKTEQDVFEAGRQKQEAAKREAAIAALDLSKLSPPDPSGAKPTTPAALVPPPAPRRRAYDRTRDGPMRIVVAGNAEDIVSIARPKVRDGLSAAGATFEPVAAKATHRLQLEATETKGQTPECGGWQLGRVISYRVLDLGDDRVAAEGRVIGGACYNTNKSQDELSYDAAQSALEQLMRELSQKLR